MSVTSLDDPVTRRRGKAIFFLFPSTVVEAEKHQLENEKDPVLMMMLTTMMIMKMSANELMTVKTLTVLILVSRASLGVSICQLSQSLT